jgi:hypothetical protein
LVSHCKEGTNLQGVEDQIAEDIMLETKRDEIRGGCRVHSKKGNNLPCSPNIVTVIK